MPRLIMLCCIISFVVACTPSDTAPATTPIPTAVPLQGQVSITSPTNGSVLYSEVIYLNGTASDLADGPFQLVVVGVEDDVIAETTIQPEDGTWTTELIHGYTGDPAEVTILARSADTTIAGDYDIVSVILSSLENRPEGTFGRITSPQEGGVIGGDSALIFGTASGIPDNILTLTLESSEGDLISEREITLPSPYPIDDVAWTAELDTNGFTGAATLTVAYVSEDGTNEMLDSIRLNISSIAG